MRGSRMMDRFTKWLLGSALIALMLGHSGCKPAVDDSPFFGKVEPPENQVMRYISGSEPESLDPQVGTGQPEARIYMSLFEGLVEYDPKTSEPIPAIAEKWEINGDSSQFIFHLRKNARWSDGRPITARDFTYTLQRGLDPSFAARNAYLAYDIQYAQAYNEGAVFARNRTTGKFLLESEVLPAPSPGGLAAEEAPARLVLASDTGERAKQIAALPKLASLTNDLEFVTVAGADLGMQAIDDYTVKVTFKQPAPYFLGLLAHQFFRAVPRQAIEKHGHLWSRPGNIVCSGAFQLHEWRPYNEIIVRRNTNYWDAANVRLDEIHFFALDEQTTMMNLYKAGAVDAIYNHTVPAGWLDQISKKKDYMDAPEATIEYYMFNVKRAPMNDIRVRKAFNMAIDKVALAKFRKTYKPLTAFTPEGIFPGYPQPKGDPFDPAQAKRLLAEAGYADASGNYDPSKFPIAEVDLTYNTAESNRQVAEFIQAQWKQNLGLTVPLKNMEFKTFLQMRANLEYKGVARSGWVADYMDPFTFLALYSTEAGDNGTGWFEPEYAEMLARANRQTNHQQRYAMLAEAEVYMLAAQPVAPLGTPSTSWMKKPYVKGMYPNPQTMHAWKFVYIEQDPSKWDHEMPSMTPSE